MGSFFAYILSCENILTRGYLPRTEDPGKFLLNQSAHDARHARAPRGHQLVELLSDVAAKHNRHRIPLILLTGLRAANNEPKRWSPRHRV